MTGFTIFRSKFLQRSSIVISSIALTLALIEVGFRVFAPEYQSYTQEDDVLGYILRPGAHYGGRGNTSAEGCPGWGSSGYINSKGLRDREFDYAKPPGTFRILALGDSYTQAIEFPLEDTWTKLLENRLNEEAPGQLHYEVINAGRTGMGTGLEYLFFIDRAYQYQPDLVLVMFVPNDFYDNSKALATIHNQPTFELRGEELYIDYSYREGWGQHIRHSTEWLRQHSYFVSYLRQLFGKFLQRNAGPWAVRSDTPEQLTPDEIDAIEVEKRLLLETKHEVESRGAEFALVIASVEHQFPWASINLGKEPEPASLLVMTSNEIVSNIAQDENITYLDLASILQDYSLTHENTLIHGCAEYPIGHWSRLGHQIAAEEIYQFLVENNLVYNSLDELEGSES